MTPTQAPPTSTALVVVAAAIACEERGLGLSRYQVLEVAKQDWRDGERSVPSLISIENFKNPTSPKWKISTRPSRGSFIAPGPARHTRRHGRTRDVRPGTMNPALEVRPHTHHRSIASSFQPREISGRGSPRHRSPSRPSFPRWKAHVLLSRHHSLTVRHPAVPRRRMRTPPRSSRSSSR